ETALEEWKPSWQALYDEGVPYNLPYPDKPAKYWFNYWAEQHPDKPYILMGDLEFSYATTNMLARRLANALLNLGVKKGDRVAIMAPNVPQYVFSLQALNKIGAIEVPTNPLYTVNELTAQFNDSGTETVIVMAMFADKAIEILKNPATPVKRVIAFQIASGPVELEQVDGLYDFNEIAMAAADTEPDIEVQVSDIARLQYTGGTTGIPKGCMLTNGNLLAQAAMTATWATGGFKLVARHDVRTLCAIPLNHIFGFNANVNVNYYCGGSVVLVPVPTPDALLDAITRHSPNIFATVPAMIIGLNHHPKIAESDISSLKGIFSGSSPLAVEVINEFERLTGGRIIEGYGMSETVNILTVNPVFTKRKIGSVGLAFPDTDLMVVDIENGTEVVPRGELGELIARGPQIMSGYWENKEVTDIAIRGGWLYTGDVVRMDEEGFIFIVDRKKDMILCSGFNVYPRDIDEVVYEMPQIMEACAIGVPHEKRGETVKVFAVLKEGAQLTKEELIEYCRTKLAPYKVPTEVEFIAELPRTSVGKPDRKAMREIEMSKR
ncbi:MAG: long-chain fatty acid--CoA ligase, partial [Syntrophomonadaceae bacterium]|nr:long-chain fatty acid--CoA ligase [Syntrophomonadaceae bacterium]